MWAATAWLDDNQLLGVILGVFGLLSVAALVPPLLRGARADRVDLSPVSLAAEHYGRRVVVRWDDVHGCVPPTGTEPLALVLRPGAQPEVTSRGWPLWRQPSAPDTVEPVVVRDLRVRPDQLASVIALCAHEPTRLTSLGNQTSLGCLTSPTVVDDAH